MIAQDLGDYDVAARQYQRALDIFERLGNQEVLRPEDTPFSAKDSAP